jgi:hypothetical protein
LTKKSKQRKYGTKKKFDIKKDLPERPEDLIRINFDKFTLYNFYELYKGKIPQVLKQLREKCDCHYLPFSVSLRTSEKTRRIKEFHLDAKILGGSSGSIEIHDSVPATKWVDAHYNANVDLGLDLTKLTKLTLIPVGGAIPIDPPVKGDVSFTIQWKPKVGEVEAGHGSRDMYWKLKKSPEKYSLAGKNEFALTLVRDRQMDENLVLHIINAKAVHDNWLYKPAVIKDKFIPLEVIKSRASPKESTMKKKTKRGR